MTLIRETNRNVLLMASMVAVMFAYFWRDVAPTRRYICNLGESQACPCIGGARVQECAEDKAGWSVGVRQPMANRMAAAVL